MSQQDRDIDPQETREWIEALDSMLEQEGIERGHYILEKLVAKARKSGAYLPYSANTAYLNTIPPSREEKSPGDAGLEWRIRSLVRWNAMAMVVKANRKNSELGGHIASFASSATLYDVGFNHFFHAPSKDHGGDLLFVQGHSAHGVFHSLVDLQTAINRFIKEYNANDARPFIWTVNPDRIIAARNRGFQTLESNH